MTWERRFQWAIPIVPFLFSAALSLSTVGSHVYWQDSGAFLCAVKELGVLYPPGYVFYLLLCKLWTQLLFFVDFTPAVHLFSSLCTALAAAFLTAAIRALLTSRGSLFRTATLEIGRASCRERVCQYV